MKTEFYQRAFIIILFIVVFFIMILYVNETRENFITSSYLTHIKNVMKNSENLIANYSDGNGRLNIENQWTYSCEKSKCIRKPHLNPNDTRVPFLSCAMLCGDFNKIWPEPATAQIQKSFKNFHLSNVQYKIKTAFKNVAELMHKAMTLFVSDIKQIVKASGGNYDGNETVVSDATVNISIIVSKYDETTLTLNSDESYHLSINTQNDFINIEISSKSFFGARHGLETLQQLIWYDNAVDSLRILDSVNINDYPKFNYRGLMLDTSRHYFSVDTIKRILVGMSHVKLNRFHWHMTDSQSFPFVSKHYPELSIYGAYSTSEVYTHEDIRDIVEFAQVRGIQIIPEIDAPAHSGNGWQFGSEKGLGDLSLCVNQQPWNNYCGEPPCGQLNPKNNNTYMVLEKLYEELLMLTKTTDYFHMGGDEINFNCWKQHFQGDMGQLWCDFMIKAHEKLTAANKNNNIKYSTIWNSDWNKMKCLPAENFTIQVWLAQNQQIQQLINAKYNIIISHVDAWYFDCGFGDWRAKSNQGSCPPFKAWNTVYKYRPWGQMSLSGDQMKQILGGEACMWTEQVDENSVDTRVWPRGIALAERLWTDPHSSVIQKETISRFSIFHTRFIDLGLKSDAVFPKYCEQNQDECL